MNLSEQITIIINGSPIPSHPDPWMMKETVSSLVHLGIDDCVRVMLVHDAPRPQEDDDRLNAYRAYLGALISEYEAIPHIEIHLLDQWGHLSGSVGYAISQVETPFCLLMMHDFPLVRDVALERLIHTVERAPAIKHVRFNKISNIPLGGDAGNNMKKWFYGQAEFPDLGVDLIRTACWSDNAHLVRTKYYRELILPVIGARRLPTENAVSIISNPLTHRIFGTFIFGKLADPPIISHLDGSQRYMGARLPVSDLAEEIPKSRHRPISMVGMVSQAFARVRAVVRFQVARAFRTLHLLSLLCGPVRFRERAYEHSISPGRKLTLSSLSPDDI